MIQYELCFWLKHVCYIKTKDCGSWRGDLCGKWHMLKSKPGNKQINFKALESTQCPGACFRWIVSRGLMVPGWTGLLWKPPPMFWQIAEFRFLEKINFLFFEPPKPFFALETPHFLGVILLKLFDMSNCFEVLDFKIGIFEKIIFKTVAQIKKF